jgi:hypothetical protein
MWNIFKKCIGYPREEAGHDRHKIQTSNESSSNHSWTNINQ